MKVYAGMDPRLGLRDAIAHAGRVERLGYDGLHVAETVHDALAVALLVAEHTERITFAPASPWPSRAAPPCWPMPPGTSRS